MGFRHGPKSIVNPETLTIVYLSDDEYTRQYEYDIVKEMSKEREGNKILVVSSYDDDTIKEYVDYFISFDNNEKLDNVFLGLEYITVGQLLALFKSMNLGVGPDSPSISGVVSRVVHGVIIYPYKKK